MKLAPTSTIISIASSKRRWRDAVRTEEITKTEWGISKLSTQHWVVMAGLVTAIHAVSLQRTSPTQKQRLGVDARDKHGHDAL